MIVGKLHPSEECPWVMPVEQKDNRLFRGLYDRRVGDPWRPVRMEFIREDGGWRATQPSDMPFYGSGVLVVNSRAKEALRDVLKECEILPLDCDETPLWAALPKMLSADVLDEERSVLKRFPSSGRIMDVRKYVFRKDLLEGQVIFRIPQVRAACFVTDRFANIVEATGLKGFAAQIVWRD